MTGFSGRQQAPLVQRPSSLGQRAPAALPVPPAPRRRRSAVVVPRIPRGLLLAAALCGAAAGVEAREERGAAAAEQNEAQPRKLATAELAESEAALWLGYGGGALLSVALLPQMLHTLRTGSTADLSYGWQAVYILGLWLDFAYFLLIGATAGWATSLLEIFFAHVLTVMKLRNEGLTCLRRKEECECCCSSTSLSVAVGHDLPLPWASQFLAEMASVAGSRGVVAHSGTYEGLPSNAVLDVEANVDELQPGFTCLVVLGAGYVLAHYDRAAGCLLLDAYVAGLAKEAQESLLGGLADFAGSSSAICEI